MLINKNSGFTLFELMISTFIASIVIMALFTAMRMGLTVWEKGEADAGRLKRVMIVKRHLKSQISSICTQNIISSNQDNKPVPFYLKGSEDMLEFVSRYSIVPDTRTNLIYVRYYVEESQETDDDKQVFYIAETDFAIMDHEMIENQKLNQDIQGHELIKGIRDTVFEYLTLDSKGDRVWQSYWDNDPTIPFLFPLAVRISFVFENTREQVIARILSQPGKQIGV